MRVSESWLEGVRERKRVGGRGEREGKIEGEKGWSVRVMAEGRVRVRRKESRTENGGKGQGISYQ